MSLAQYGIYAVVISMGSFTLLVLLMYWNRSRNISRNLSKDIGALSLAVAASIVIAFATELLVDSNTPCESWRDAMNEFRRAFAIVIFSAVFFITFLVLGFLSLAYGYWKDRAKNPKSE